MTPLVERGLELPSTEEVPEPAQIEEPAPEVPVHQEETVQDESPRQIQPPSTYAEVARGTPVPHAPEQGAAPAPTDPGPTLRRSTRQSQPLKWYIAEIRLD